MAMVASGLEAAMRRERPSVSRRDGCRRSPHTVKSENRASARRSRAARMPSVIGSVVLEQRYTGGAEGRSGKELAEFLASAMDGDNHQAVTLLLIFLFGAVAKSVSGNSENAYRRLPIGVLRDWNVHGQEDECQFSVAR
jgi:hypothetical protein